MIFNSRNAINTLICGSTTSRHEREISVAKQPASQFTHSSQIASRQIKKLTAIETLALFFVLEIQHEICEDVAIEPKRSAFLVLPLRNYQILFKTTHLRHYLKDSEVSSKLAPISNSYKKKYCECA